MTSWRDRLRDQAEVNAAETRKNHAGASQTANISRVGFSSLVHPFLVRACRQRGISVAGYIRRATLARVAADLGLTATDLFALDVGITPIGRIGSRPTKDLDGALYGRWEVDGDATDRGDII